MGHAADVYANLMRVDAGLFPAVIRFPPEETLHSGVAAAGVRPPPAGLHSNNGTQNNAAITVQARISSMPCLPRELPAKMTVHLLCNEPDITEEKPSLSDLICEQGALSSFETGLDL